MEKTKSKGRDDRRQYKSTNKKLWLYKFKERVKENIYKTSIKETPTDTPNVNWSISIM